MVQCPECEYPLQPAKTECCPKCGLTLRGRTLQGMLEVDVAHSGETWDVARGKIHDAMNLALLHGHSGLKVIHGWGASTGKPSLAGLAVSLLRSYGLRYGGRLVQDRNNPGAHILWLNR